MGGNMHRRKDLAGSLKSTIICEKCGSTHLKTCDSRETMGIKRRCKRCLDCGDKFTTYEIHKDDFIKTINCIRIMDKETIELLLEFSELGQKVSKISCDFDLEM